jgi:predicted enzyme related to lactoylglutathione lyase
MNANNGRFVWFDLMTSDEEGAQRFYSEAIGWRTMPFEGGDEPYTMFAVGDAPIGGTMKLPPEMAAAGVPPHWLAYMQVEDVDASVARAKELGGRVLKGAWDIPTVGRVAMVSDPQGAPFAFFQPDEEMELRDKSPGFMAWHELNTTDYEAAWNFYRELSGWKHTDSMDIPEVGPYFMFTAANPRPEEIVGGISNVAGVHNVPAHWLHYTMVDDIDAAMERIKSHGGAIANGPMEVPGGDWIAQCVDPQGAAFAVVGPRK